MTNRNKEKGDRYERDILKMCRDAGFTWAERTRPGRREDEGDIHVAPGLIAQTKDVATPNWRDWLTELADQIRCARASHGFLVVKRRGVGGRPPIHLAVMPLENMLDLLREAGWTNQEGRK